MHAPSFEGSKQSFRPTDSAVANSPLILSVQRRDVRSARPGGSALLRLGAMILCALLTMGGKTLAAATPSLASPVRPLILHTAAAVHNLAPELANNARVDLVGTVTYYDPFEHTLFLQDATGGVYIGTSKPYPLQMGDIISVIGKTDPSFRTEVAIDPLIRVLSHGIQRTPTATDFAQLASGVMDSKLVTLRGRVRAVNIEQHENAPILHLDVNMPGGEIEVYQPVSVVTPETMNYYVGLQNTSLLDSLVQIVGVAGGAFDTKSQLTGIIVYSQTSSAIRVLQPAKRDPLALPLTDIDAIFQSRHVMDRSSRVRLRGTLTYYKKGDSAVLEQMGKSVYVQTRETKDIPLGNTVDALGFASDQEYAPSLRQAELFDTGLRGTVTPQPVTYDQAFSGLYSDNLVSLEGTVVSQMHGTGAEILVVDVDGHLVTSQLLTGRLQPQEKLGNIRLGARVRITGVCRIVPGGPWRAPTMFHIALRGPEDVQLISAPSWWTVRHLVELLSTMAVAALAIIAWAMLLRRRVKQQTESIQRSMLIARKRSTLLEKISSNQPAEDILQQICACVPALLPGTQCRYSLSGELDPSTDTLHGARPEETRRVLHEVILHGVDERVVGRLRIVSWGPDANLQNAEEVFAMTSEVATLSMRQSLLYQGLVHHSTHDPLTDLPNRRLCDHRLRLALAAAAQEGTRLAVVYIDVNRFKHVNDRYGHKAGDLYLKEISARLKTHIRSTDTLARIGGDEFLVIAPQTSSSDEIGLLDQRLQRCFTEPFLLEGTLMEGSASFGLACFPEHGSTPEELKRYADHAMYLAKRNASVGEAQPPASDLAILTPDELAIALERKQFSLAYQPQFGADGSLRGMEALLRLQDSILGTLTPDAFISVAERCDTILGLGRWVLETALADAMRWDLHNGPPVMMVVNVSLRQILDPEFSRIVLSALKTSGFPADRLELELTERTLISNSQEVKRQLDRVRAEGVRVSLDDFGTGHSSLSLLHQLPIDTIKIDRSFVIALDREPNVMPVIQAITCMAQGLGKRIVAEGVETTSSVPALMRMGEMDFQGYLLSQPLVPEQIDQILATWRAGLIMPAAFRDGTLEQHPALPSRHTGEPTA